MAIDTRERERREDGQVREELGRGGTYRTLDEQEGRLPAELAFAADGATMAPVFPTVLREVVNSLSGVPQRLTPHIEMRLCATKFSDTLRARAVAIGAALTAEKAPLKQFSVGIADCDPKAIGIAVALAPAVEPLPANAGEQAQ